MTQIQAGLSGNSHLLDCLSGNQSHVAPLPLSYSDGLAEHPLIGTEVFDCTVRVVQEACQGQGVEHVHCDLSA